MEVVSIASPKSACAGRGRWALLVSVALAGWGCGLDTNGYADGSPDPTATTAGSDDPTATTIGDDGSPAAAVLELSFSQVKRLDFSWTAVAADSYQLWESPGIGQDYAQVGKDLSADSIALSLTVPLHFRANASYFLKACNAMGCTDSEPVQVMGSMAEAVGYFKASNTGAEDWFGNSVAMSADGNTLAISAWGEASDGTGVNMGDQNDDSIADSGAVYVFIRAGGTWTQQAYVKASNTGGNDQFGISIALSADGDTLAIGAQFEDSNAVGVDKEQGNELAVDSGAVYVFHRLGETWSQQAYVKASNTDEQDYFGSVVALSGDGDTLAVGAVQEDSSAEGVGGDQDSGAMIDAGAVYVFKRVDGGWSQLAYVKASNPGLQDQFGKYVALSGDGKTLAVGARFEDSNAKGIDNEQANDDEEDSGAVYLFKREADTWTQQAYVKASNTGTTDYFGVSIALSADGEVMAVGAVQEDSNALGINVGNQNDGSAIDSGAVYVFKRDDGAWTQEAYVKASNTGGGDLFGWSVALSPDGETLAVGAVFEDSGAKGIGGDQGGPSTGGAGAVYVFKRATGAWTQAAYVKASNTDALNWFGSSVALNDDSGTLDAYGYTHTLVVGAIWEQSNTKGIGGNQDNNSANKAGAVYLY